MIVKARYVAPVCGPVLENAAVEIQDGRIAGVGTADELPGPSAIDYDDAVIVPGLVNAHTHLELTALASSVPPTEDFADWLLRLVQARRTSLATRQDVEQSVRIGAEQSLRAGVTTVGDITSSPRWTRPVLVACPLRAVSFGEVITAGPVRQRLDQQIEDALEECCRVSDKQRRAPEGAEVPAGAAIPRSSSPAHPHLVPGLSPHAPYTVEPEAMRLCARRAAEADAPLSMHLAETAGEERFIRSGDGPLRALLESLGAWDESARRRYEGIASCSPVELAFRTGLLTPRTVVAHANYVSDGDIRLLGRGGASVACCPRTHHAFGHSPHRFRDMLSAGINVCVGTDSLASNPSLSVLDELRFLRRGFPDLPSDTILAMGTLNGARALGVDPFIGSLSVGKEADLVVFPCPPGSGVGWDVILEASTPPLAVYVAGRAGNS